MEKIVEWMKNITIFYIIATIFVQLIPNEKYQKYFNWFIGVLMILLIIKPVGSLLNLTDTFSFNYAQADHIVNMDSMSQEFAYIEEQQNSVVKQVYEEYVRDDLEKYLYGLGAELKEVKLTLEKDGTISYMNVGIAGSRSKNDSIIIDGKTDPVDGLLEIEIKNYISNFYNLHENNINVYISE